VHRPALSLALCGALLAGCGGDDEAGNGGGRAVSVKAGGEARVVGREYSFEPSKIVVVGAGEVTLTLDNEGSLAHNLKVFEGEDELGGTPTFQGGQVRSGRVRLESGSYRMVCTVGNHEQLGMVGTLEVRPP
jgi:plastocyanin